MYTQDNLEGLDNLALQIITQRYEAIDRHLAPYFGIEQPWHRVLRYPPKSDQRQRIVSALEHTACSATATNQNLTYLLLPLASDLGFVADAERGLVTHCLGRRWFEPVPIQNRPHTPPALESLLPRINTIFQTHATLGSRADALLAEGICRTRHIAYLVAKELQAVQRRAVGLVQALLCAYSTYGSLGLIYLSAHPLVMELLYLERYADYIASLSDHDTHVMRELRQDLLALHTGLYTVALNLWQPHLLYEPPYSPQRARFATQIKSVRGQVIAGIKEARQCQLANAELLLEHFEARGLSGLIDWRSQYPGHTTASRFEQQQLVRMVEQITMGMAPWAREECQRLVKTLHTVANEIQFSLSLKPLLTELPSSRRRRVWGWCFWFGLPKTMQRKHQRLQQRRHRRRLRRYGYETSQGTRHLPMRDQHKQPQRKSREDELVACFAEAASLTETDARTRLRNLLTYGVLGLLPREQWLRTLPAELISWLHLIKLGRLDGTVIWSELLSTAELYCQSRKITQPSAQIIHAIFYSIPKPRFWHGGQGSAVDAVRQRATLHSATRPRLNSVWQILPIALRRKATSNQNKYDYLLLVVDPKCQLPIGAWLSETAPGMREVCLALYQSIWHPELPDWPIRGLPEVIQIPAELISVELSAIAASAQQLLWQVDQLRQPNALQQTDADDLRQSLLNQQTPIRSTLKVQHSHVNELMYWLAQGNTQIAQGLSLPRVLLPPTLRALAQTAQLMLARVELVERSSLEGKPIIRALRDKIRDQGPDILTGHRAAGIAPERSFSELLVAIQQWSFPHHRSAPTPGKLTEHGVGMAGWDTLCAGWLLPTWAVDMSQTETIVYLQQRYRLAPDVLLPDQRVSIRAYPYIYSRRSARDREPGVFVETLANDIDSLTYLEANA